MAQLFFRYGCVNSGKSIDILKVAYNYEEMGGKVVLFTSSLDDRDGVGKVASRIGISRDAIAVNHDENLFIKTTKMIGESKNDIDCVLVDEAQFLSKKQVLELAKVVDYLNIPVMCFGLKNDFQNKLFEGTEALLLYADKIEEIKTLCWYCKKKAIMNLRISDGTPVYEGETVKIGGNESYRSVCRKHYSKGYHMED